MVGLLTMAMFVQRLLQWWCNEIRSYGRAPDNCNVCAKDIAMVVQGIEKLMSLALSLSYLKDCIRVCIRFCSIAQRKCVTICDWHQSKSHGLL